MTAAICGMPRGRQVGLVEEDPAEVLAVGEHLVLHRQERAAGVDEVDAGQPVVGGDGLRAQVLLDRDRVVGAALDGRVVGDDHALAAADPADAGDDAGAGDGSPWRPGAVHPGRGERAELEERAAGVEQPVDPVADQQLAAVGVLACGPPRCRPGGRRPAARAARRRASLQVLAHPVRLAIVNSSLSSLRVHRDHPPRPDPRHRRRAVRRARLPRRLGRRPRRGLRHLRPGALQALPAKDAMLAEMLVSISEELLRGRPRAARRRPTPSDAALRGLVDWHVDFALRHRPLIVVQDRDWESLPADARERVRDPAARVRRALGRPAPPLHARPPAATGPGDRPRRVRADQLHAPQRAAARRPRCAALLDGWRSGRSALVGCAPCVSGLWPADGGGARHRGRRHDRRGRGAGRPGRRRPARHGRADGEPGLHR